MIPVAFSFSLQLGKSDEAIKVLSECAAATRCREPSVQLGRTGKDSQCTIRQEGLTGLATLSKGT